MSTPDDSHKRNGKARKPRDFQDPKTGRFVPGNNANPAGNKMMKAAWHVRRILEEETEPEKIRAIWAKALAMAAKGDRHMIVYVIDRIAGKPKQTVELEGDLSTTIRVMREGFNRMGALMREQGVEIDFSPN